MAMRACRALCVFSPLAAMSMILRGMPPGHGASAAALVKTAGYNRLAGKSEDRTL